MQLLPGVTPQAALVERLEVDQNRSRPHHLQRVDQLLATAELAGGDEVLHADHHHRDHRPGLRHAGGFGHHANLHDLRLDLPEAGDQGAPPGTLGNEDPGRPHERIDDVTHPQRELLHAPAHAGPDDGLRQFRLGLGQGGLGACLCAGSRVEICTSAACLPAVAAATEPWRPSTTFWSRSRSRSATVPGLRRWSSCFVSSSSTACCWALLASWILPSAARTSVRAATSAASTSAILRRAASAAASCVELSSLKMGAPASPQRSGRHGPRRPVR